jgi:hypothetical protein
VSDLGRERVEGWAILRSQISIRYDDLLKREKALKGYCELLIHAQIVTARDCLQISQLWHQCWELSYASTANIPFADRELRKLVAQRLSEAKARVEAAFIGDNPHPEVAKFLGHLSELSHDFEVILNLEISLGRDLADAKEEFGGPDKFRALLKAECPWLKWEEAERFMSNAMDSPLAAKLDEEFESGLEDDEQK